MIAAIGNMPTVTTRKRSYFSALRVGLEAMCPDCNVFCRVYRTVTQDHYILQYRECPQCRKRIRNAHAA